MTNTQTAASVTFNSHDALAAENARLREALTAIANNSHVPGLLRQEARAALEAK